MKRHWKNHHKLFGKSYKPLKVFAHPLKALREQLKPLEKPLATRWLAIVLARLTQNRQCTFSRERLHILNQPV